MDKIILGLLMLQRLTAYKIRSIIDEHFWGVCSSSPGSVQAAIKKLLKSEMITCTEYVEKSVNKKEYSITDKGRKEILAWTQTPADVAAATNMEWGKLMFMGIVPAEKRNALIDEIIVIAEEKLAYHLDRQASIDLSNTIEQSKTIFDNDPEYLTAIQDAMQNTDDLESINSLIYFQMMTLQYYIDKVKFEIEWFKKFKERGNYEKQPQ